MQVDACPSPDVVREVAAQKDSTVAMSALRDEDIAALAAAVEVSLQDLMTPAQMLIPYSHGDLVTAVHRSGSVKDQVFTEHGTRLTAHLPSSLSARLRGLGFLDKGAARMSGSEVDHSLLIER